MAKTVWWVQYEAAVFVRIEVDEDGWDTEITKVVTANDAEELHLARDDRGHFRVYDERFEPASESEVLDGIRGAVSIAEDRHRWPEKRYPAWDDGIDPGAIRTGTPTTRRPRTTTPGRTVRHRSDGRRGPELLTDSPPAPRLSEVLRDRHRRVLRRRPAAALPRPLRRAPGPGGHRNEVLARACRPARCAWCASGGATRGRALGHVGPRRRQIEPLP